MKKKMQIQLLKVIASRNSVRKTFKKGERLTIVATWAWSNRYRVNAINADGKIVDRIVTPPVTLPTAKKYAEEMANHIGVILQ